jgi:hypothetical protein
LRRFTYGDLLAAIFQRSRPPNLFLKRTVLRYFFATADAGVFGFAGAAAAFAGGGFGFAGCGFGLAAGATGFGLAILGAATVADVVVAASFAAPAAGLAAGLAAAISAANRDRTESSTIQPASSPRTNPIAANAKSATTAAVTAESVPAPLITPRRISVKNASGPRIPA